MAEETYGGEEPQLVRLALPDLPGRLALVANRFAAHDVNILRVEVVEGGDGSAVDDLLVVGGNLALALDELRGDVQILGLREHAELPDPGLAMADALASVSGAASLGAARHARSSLRSSSSRPTGRAAARCRPRLAPACRRHRRVAAADPGGRALPRASALRAPARRPRRRRNHGRPRPTRSRSAWAASSSCPPARRRSSRSQSSATTRFRSSRRRWNACGRCCGSRLGPRGARRAKRPSAAGCS